MIRAHHFVGDKLRDGRPVPTDGEWLVHDGPVKMCESGLHASRHPFDALMYAPGPVLGLVDCDEIDAEENDKLVCRRRRIVARFDATTMPPKTVLSSDCRLQLACMKPELLVNARQL